MSTAVGMRHILDRFVVDVGGDTASLTVGAVERWLGDRQGLAVSSRRTQFSTVRKFCAWLTLHGHLSANPALEVAKPRATRTVPRAMSGDHVAQLLAVVHDQRDRAMVVLMVEVGLRCAEVTGLGFEEWDQHAETILVRGKGGHERLLPLPRRATKELEAYLVVRPGARSGPLFRSHRDLGKGIRPKTLSRLLAEWMWLAGIKKEARDGVSAHALRHTAASDVLDRCGDLRVVQEMMGHANIATTSIYLRRASMGRMREAMEGRDYDGESGFDDGGG